MKKQKSKKQRKNQTVSNLTRTILEIAFVMIVIPAVIVGIGIFSTNDFQFLSGLYLWDFLTK